MQMNSMRNMSNQTQKIRIHSPKLTFTTFSTTEIKNLCQVELKKRLVKCMNHQMKIKMVMFLLDKQNKESEKDLDSKKSLQKKLSRQQNQHLQKLQKQRKLSRKKLKKLLKKQRRKLFKKANKLKILLNKQVKLYQEKLVK